MNDTELAEIGFEAYGDLDGNMVVLTNPGPDVPVGTLAAVESYAHGRIDDPPNGHAGTVRYVPGKHDGEVVEIEIEDGGASA